MPIIGKTNHATKWRFSQKYCVNIQILNPNLMSKYIKYKFLITMPINEKANHATRWPLSQGRQILITSPFIEPVKFALF